MAQDIVFRGIAAPLRLDGAEAVRLLLPVVAAGWPHEFREADPAAVPFFSIRSDAGESLLLCQSHVEATPARRHDPVNALCDMIAALALALPAEDPSLICLHAAGVAMAGRLVVFPSVRRAGKSTLSVALARAGHALYGDDVLPLCFAADNRAFGYSMGIAPRLRLPLPASIERGFRDWVDALDGPRNRQYKYLTLKGQPAQGAALPVGAFVILDRHEVPVPARLCPVTPDVAMDALLHQNFTRDRHSADILQAMAASLSNLPVFRLSFSALSDAVACLETAFSRWPDIGAPDAPAPALPFRKAGIGQGVRRARAPDALLGQRQGTVERTIGGSLYLADVEGWAIHRMDPIAAAIWGVLDVPVTRPELETLLVDTFPEVGHDRIAADLGRLLDHFAHAGLIEAKAGG
ncbi:MAG: hypothetical protein C0524_05920 [Rhodobacter sp.]|nr:hypothetical protein [Rhodobacter sp.]